MQEGYFVPEVNQSKRVTLNKKTKKKLIEGIKQNAETTRTMWNALTHRLPTNTTKLLALCMIPVLYQTAIAAVGNVSIYVDPGDLNSIKVFKKIEEESPEITYICIPEEFDQREKKDVDKFGSPELQKTYDSHSRYASQR